MKHDLRSPITKEQTDRLHEIVDKFEQRSGCSVSEIMIYGSACNGTTTPKSYVDVTLIYDHEAAHIDVIKEDIKFKSGEFEFRGVYRGKYIKQLALCQTHAWLTNSSYHVYDDDGFAHLFRYLAAKVNEPLRYKVSWKLLNSGWNICRNAIVGDEINANQAKQIIRGISIVARGMTVFDYENIRGVFEQNAYKQLEKVSRHELSAILSKLHLALTACPDENNETNLFKTSSESAAIVAAMKLQLRRINEYMDGVTNMPDEKPSVKDYDPDGEGQFNIFTVGPTEFSGFVMTHVN